MSIKQDLWILVQNQAMLASAPAPIAASVPPIIEPVLEELAQGVILNNNNLSAALHLVNIAEEPTIFVTRLKCKA